MKWLKTNWIAFALVVSFAALAVICLIAPQWLELVMLPILMLPVYGILIFGLVIPNSIAAGGGLLLLSVLAGCFIPAFVMRWRIPEQVKIVTKYWPLICFLVGMSYWSPITTWAETRWFVPFYLCLMPALAGLAIGKMVRHWCS